MLDLVMQSFEGEERWSKSMWRLNTVNEFVGESGPNVSINSTRSIEIFHKLFPPTVIDLITKRANESSVEREISEGDVRRFLAASLYMSVKPRDDRRDYWSDKPEIRDDQIASIINEDDFDWFANKMAEIGDSVVDVLSKTFAESMKPSRDQIISRSRVMLGNRVRDIWYRHDSSGYVCQFAIRDIHSGFVWDLTQTLIGRGHRVYMLSNENAEELVQSMRDMEIYSCCAIDTHVGKSILGESDQMKAGDIDFAINTNGLTCVKWVGDVEEYYITNIHKPMDFSIVSGTYGNGNTWEILCPTVVADHKRLSRVARVNRPKSSSIFWHLFDIAVTNSHVLHRMMFGSSMSLNEFRCSVAVGLYQGRKRKMRAATKKDGEHLPVWSSSRRCARCSTKAEPHRSLWSCVTCNVGLCLSRKRNCFRYYHE